MEPESMITHPSLHSFESYAQDVVKFYPKKRKVRFLPINSCPDRFITIEIRGILPITLLLKDHGFHEALEILGFALKGIYSTYGHKNYFTEPQIIYPANSPCLQLKIGILEKKKWLDINKKRRLTKKLPTTVTASNGSKGKK